MAQDSDNSSPLSDMSRRALFSGLGAGITYHLRGLEKVQTSLLRDPRFANGAEAWQMTPVARKSVGTIRPLGKAEVPASWGIAQWYSRNNIASAKPERLPSGSTRFFDGTKTVIFGQAGNSEADLVLGVNGAAEYGDHVPDKRDPWPHLKFQQSIESCPRLSKILSLPYTISYRLLYSESPHARTWDDRYHTAHFEQRFIVQNRDRSSAGFGDYFWFGLPVYDARYAYPKGLQKVDLGSIKKQATGKFIFDVTGESLATSPASDGKWHTTHADALPYMIEGLDTAAAQGFLPASHDPAHFEIQTTTVGWEVSAPSNVAMQIRDMQLQVVLKS